MSMRRLLVFVASGMILTMLFFGLRPKGLTLRNRVEWLENGDGIAIERYGVVYTDIHDALGVIDEKEGVTIGVSLRPASLSRREFMSLLMIYGDTDETQLIIGQWKSSIIAMNGDDYDNKRRTPKIFANNVLTSEKANFITVRSSKDKGTDVFCNGSLVSGKSDLVLTLPRGKLHTYLVAGNSVHGHSTWVGELYELTIWPYALSDKRIILHHKGGYGPESRNPIVQYDFNNGGGYRVKDHASGRFPLTIPEKVTILKKEFLSANWDGLQLNKSMIYDITLNLFGFLPIGILISVLASEFFAVRSARAVVLSVGVSFILSLIIETGQVWMPSRNSSLLDLILNTLGGGAGGLAGYFLLRRRKM